MDLIVWRHAEAEDASPEGGDLARSLTPRGQKQAARMGAWLSQRLPRDATIWASPAKRTMQTAMALNRNFRMNPALAPDADVQSLLDLAHWPQGKGAVVVVGHQPTLGQAVSKLLGMQVPDVSVKKGSVWWLRYRARDGVGQTVVVTVQTVDML